MTALASALRSVSLDRVGMAASFACAVHCAVLPFALPLLPLLGIAWMANEWVEWTLVGLVFCGASLASHRGHRRHGNRRPAALMAAGLTLVVLGRLCEAQHWPAGVPLLVVGGLVISVGHFHNHKLLCTHSACHR